MVLLLYHRVLVATHAVSQYLSTNSQSEHTYCFKASFQILYNLFLSFTITWKYTKNKEIININEQKFDVCEQSNANLTEKSCLISFLLVFKMACKSSTPNRHPLYTCVCSPDLSLLPQQKNSIWVSHTNNRRQTNASVD